MYNTVNFPGTLHLLKEPESVNQYLGQTNSESDYVQYIFCFLQSFLEVYKFFYKLLFLMINKIEISLNLNDNSTFRIVILLVNRYGICVDFRRTDSKTNLQSDIQNFSVTSLVKNELSILVIGVIFLEIISKISFHSSHIHNLWRFV